jgi:hypothetical protein
LGGKYVHSVIKDCMNVVLNYRANGQRLLGKPRRDLGEAETCLSRPNFVTDDDDDDDDVNVVVSAWR